MPMLLAKARSDDGPFSAARGPRMIARWPVRAVAVLAWLAAPAALAQVGYEVSLPEDVEPAELGTAIAASSNLEALAEEPPPSIAGLIRRAEGDVERLRAALRSYGFYEGEVTIALNGVPLT